MKAADTKIIKGVKEFICDILTPEANADIKDCFIDFSFGINNVLKSKNKEKISFNFNFKVSSDNFPCILNENKYLEKIKSWLGKRIEKKIRYLKVYWIFKERTDIESNKLCFIDFEVKY